MRSLKMAAALLFAGLGACEVTTSSYMGHRDPTPEEDAIASRVREQFEAWRLSTINGDFMAHYQGMTAQLVSDWLWRRSEDKNDTTILKWLAALEGQPRKVFEIWREHNNKYKPERAEMLPNEIITSNWLTRCYEDYFKAEFEGIKQQMSISRVKEVAVDAQGATVVTSLMGQKSERWVMVVCIDGKWRVDGYIPPGR
jgi:hypothetical protein